jgi:hypothetical protein
MMMGASTLPAAARNGAPVARAHRRGQAANGLNRWRYKTDGGMQRWAALGLISDNLVNIGRLGRGPLGQSRTHQASTSLVSGVCLAAGD